jgi:large subunit ribosomal protein L18
LFFAWKNSHGIYGYRSSFSRLQNGVLHNFALFLSPVSWCDIYSHRIMFSHTKQKRVHAALRAQRTRSHLRGTNKRPRLSVKRSLKHIYAQLIDDTSGKTLVSASDKLISAKGKPVEVAKEVGKQLAAQAVSVGITQAVFDRGAYRYHGRVAALADGAREGGLIF